MKRLICIVGCMVIAHATMYGMEGVVYGALAPAFVGLCYAVGTADSLESTMTRVIGATTVGAAVGGLSYFFLRGAVQKNHLSIVGTATAAFGCSFAQIWILSKMISNCPRI